MNVFGEEERHDALPLSADESRFCIFSVRFSNDGNEILGGANDGFIYLFDRESQQQSLRLDLRKIIPALLLVRYLCTALSKEVFIMPTFLKED